MKLSRFKYKYPEELVAKYPLEHRDESRLMVVHRDTGKIEHRIFKEILDYFEEGDVFVFNNSKVFPARLYGNKERTGAIIEVFLLRELNAESKLWDVLVEPARKIRIGNKLFFGDNEELVAEVIDNTTSRGRTLRFLFDGPHDEFKKLLYSLGHTPIPRYLGREAEPIDEIRYQSLLAKIEGSTSPSTASLHFSRELLKKMEVLGIQKAEITLHIGPGGYRPVEVEDLTKHKTESEEFFIEPEQAEIINTAIKARKKVCAVGTSVVKALESSVTTDKLVKPCKSTWSSKFIFPPYNFQIPTCMVANFYQPETTLMMAAAAFCGMDLLEKAYQTAIKEKYRLFCYGDAMLIL
ncbi:MAG: tRNA preQ1(34) S-adenosylmethionine ribosyltransferase-isomerase QueA [Flavobacteriales bacterium]|nr:tRNA preQ1(34) S-adenosylmethionine ribosyltransferase-isomerase QueA [Flavobacteriales bacterium]MCX7769147.1 tRNA preQ1(34) S-adenosylmethionine ribosyltransferase-isomerase QueA [Flavobacteriales bacterium]MDW8410151.1 tRNA preQ1(34) S-adenosylmethionine ribosyltransferase-isomerase QueA [Flavobacteriales bacterium]